MVAPVAAVPRRYRPLPIVAAAAAAGIFADRRYGLPLGVWWLVCGVAIAAWVLLWPKRRPAAAGAAVLLAVAALAGAWHHCRWSLFAGDEIGYYAAAEPAPVCLEAVALASPRPGLVPAADPLRSMPARPRTRLTVAVASLRDGAEWHPASGRAEVWIDGECAGPRAGDRLRIFGELIAPRRATNPGGFDVAAYLRGDRRLCLVRAPHAEGVYVVEPGGWSLGRAIDALRRQASGVLWNSLDPRRAGLAAAVLLGDREQLDPEQANAYLETGTVHLLVVSGLNVAILAWAAWFVSLRIGLRGWSGMAAVAGLCTSYMILTGAEPPVVRATVLVLSTFAAMALGRRSQAADALALGAIVVLAANPADLFNAGAQLSFLSVGALAWLTPRLRPTNVANPLDRLIARARPLPLRVARAAARVAGEAALVGLVVWLVIQPLVAARFHIVTPIAPLVNPLLALPVYVAMLAGMASLALGWVAPVGQLAAGCCDAALAAMQHLVGAARWVPGGHFWIPGPADWWLGGLYGGLGLWLIAPRYRPRRRWVAAALAAWATVGLAPALAPPNRSLRCTFVSVGHGAAVVLQLPDGQTLLYDCGQLGTPQAVGRTVSEVLWSQGIAHLDAVVLSHPDLDHYNGLPTLLDRFSVGAIYVPPMMFADDTPALTELRRAIAAAGIEPQTLVAGDRLRAGGDCRIDVLHPPPLGVPGDDNANSLVLAIEAFGRRLLLPGDLASPGLEQVLAEPALKCDLLLAPHHGSRRSHPSALARWCRPEWIVVSGGQNDPLAPPADSPATYFYTARQGAVAAEIGPGPMSVRPFCGGD